MEWNAEHDIVIVGGGVSGLACAQFLRIAGHDPVVLDAAGRPGGKLWSEEQNGLLLEHGPASLRGSAAALEELVESLDLADELVFPSSAASHRFILRDGVPQPLPGRPAEVLGTRLFSGRAKLRAAAEPLIPRRRETAGEESVSDWTTRRFGAEANDYAVEPFVAGIFAGDPDLLSVESAFPILAALETRHGSVLRGALKSMRARRRRDQASPAGAGSGGAARSGQLSFKRGVSTLTDAIAARLGERLQLDACVTMLRPTGSGYEITLQHRGRQRRLQAKRVVLAVPAYAAAELLRSEKPAAADALAAIPYPPVMVVSAAYPASALREPLDGFGMLIPRREHRRILGVIYASSVFPHRSPEGRVLVTIFVGGARDAELLRRTEQNQLRRQTLAELEELLGIRGEPELVRETLWERAIPQYTLGHSRRMAALDELESEEPRLRLLGNYRGGVAIADCLREARRAAATLMSATA